MDDVQSNKKLDQLAQRIKERRIAAGYTSHETFANDKGFARKQYWRLESGFDFKMSTLLRLSEAHNMSLSEFLEGL
ncbi:MAG: hypothetical protein ABJG41_14925 [Cyclobacteriaceae bacterium]